MREFTDALGRKFDLDDPETYKHLSQDTGEVLDCLYKAIGYANLYVLGRKFAKSEAGKTQIERIEKFVVEVAKVFGGNIWKKPTIFWQEKLFIFLDEIENMC